MNLKSIIIYLIIFLEGKANCQNWYSVGDYFDNQAVSLYSDSVLNKLFIAGNFRKIGTKIAKGVAAWDGQSWDTLNGGMDFQPAKFVTRYSGDLYCCGLFRKSNGINGVTTNGFAKWNGLSWDSVNIGFNPGGPYDYTIYNGLLYLVGSFGTVNNSSCSSATIWDGSNFINIGIPNPSINGGQTCTFFNGKFYMAGVFSDITSSIYHLASWDGIQWQQVSTTVDGYFLSMAVYHNELYLSGWGIIGPGQFIIKYDGVNFSSVGGDLSAQAYKLKVINDRLFAVGVFDFAGGVPCS